MKYTNTLNLPPAIASVLMADDYERGDADFTATELIAPARQRALMLQHDHELEVDVASRVWMVFGNAVHSLVERHGDDEHAIKELRLERAVRIDGKPYTVSGQIDYFDTERGLLLDWKTTSVWSVLGGKAREEWEKQLNIYAWLLRGQDEHVERIQAMSLLKDWSPSTKRRSGPDYPDFAMQPFDIIDWGDEATEFYVRERVLEHLKAREDVEAARCADEEVWRKPEKWALMKHGRKSAVKLYDDRGDCSNAALGLGEAHYVEHRPGSAVRCELYCDVSEFCSQWRAEKGGQDD